MLRLLFAAAVLLTVNMGKYDRYDSLFSHYNDDGKIDWRYMKAQAMAESAMNPGAKSPVGAAGLTQFMPATWQDVMGDVPLADPEHPEYAIIAQARYMRRLLDMFDGDLEKATAAYNWGPGRVARAVARYGDEWFAHTPAETKKYVPRIEALYREYLKEDV